MTEEAHSELPEDIDLFVFELVVDVLLIHSEPELLTDDIVEGNDKPECSKHAK